MCWWGVFRYYLVNFPICLTYFFHSFTNASHSFQSSQSVGNYLISNSELNELNSIKICLLRAISCARFSKGGQNVLMQMVSVDMPCSQNVFLRKFVCSVQQIMYDGEDSYKCKVMPSHLKYLFGNDWHIFIYTKSSTQRRIIGLISLHFRKKSLKICDKVHTVR